jgi:hypothetical protein
MTLREDKEVRTEIKHNQMILPKDMKAFTKMRCKNNKCVHESKYNTAGLGR